MIVAKAKLTIMETKLQINTALLAAAHARLVCARCASSKNPKSGTAKLSSARCCSSSSSELRSVRASNAPKTARDVAAPRLRSVLRLDVTTVRGSFGQYACSATRVGWKMLPRPNDHYGLSRSPFSVTISESLRPRLVSFLSSRIVHLTALEIDCCGQLTTPSIRRNRAPQMSRRERRRLSREEDQVLGFHLCTKLLVRDGSYRHRE
jgi:hypothetical protein